MILLTDWLNFSRFVVTRHQTETPPRLTYLIPPRLCCLQEEAVWKALAYYDSCMDVEEIERLKGKPLERLIAEYGSWSITDKSWLEQDWELIPNLANVHKYLALPVLFSTTVVIDHKNSSQNVITVIWTVFLRFHFLLLFKLSFYY